MHQFRRVRFGLIKRKFSDGGKGSEQLSVEVSCRDKGTFKYGIMRLYLEDRSCKTTFKRENFQHL